MEPPPDLNTHLPPRKRLLAGLRTAATAAEPLPPPPAHADLAARLREMALAANASASSPEETIEAARAAAQAAADAAVAARAVAAEKAAVAAKARAAARAAMEFIDSFSTRAGASRNGSGLQFKIRSRKKHVQVKMLYRPNGTLGPAEAPKPRRRKQSDEEVPHNLHRLMNSSPRISHAGLPKRPRTTAAGDAKNGAVAPGGGNGAGVCNGSSVQVPTEAGGWLGNGCSEAKSHERTVPLLNHEVSGEDSSRHAAKSSGGIADNGVGVGNSSAGQKVKVKRKELLLNQNTGKEREEPEEATQTEPFVRSITLDESKPNSKGKGRSNPNGNGTERLAGPADTKGRGEGVTPPKITSVWKIKKLKTSHCSSDSKVLHKVCVPPPTAAETSASVKAD
ncbi:hypothetical protein Zm00014a_038616 [Zea mays]|jgi:hypothetical protein|uniref:Uncharacterized protein n=3 Tax=Zea mays TaxID=4577 RepID=A0A8J8Y1X4_MAIZE|nr:uncharacterized protein LOC103626480 [Zea mays]XP_008645112.1 uncharacterized protein LOC103626480 [Zea mays]AQK67329.1 hypothetical protein ZEAMMB73_Zm00001d014861 [Zea mays]PWZ22094.1 hypothetical protein Zm00014a_038616 [Zea mays]|eukprot:XP_008645111.1 uncharacterized protein LOC103626480 [Zea mays]